MKIDQFKKRFRESMTFLYPLGVTDRQLLDLIRVYFAGLVDFMCDAGFAPSAAEWFKEMEFLKKGSWKPDASWKWWVQ